MNRGTRSSQPRPEGGLRVDGPPRTTRPEGWSRSSRASRQSRSARGERAALQPFHPADLLLLQQTGAFSDGGAERCSGLSQVGTLHPEPSEPLTDLNRPHRFCAFLSERFCPTWINSWEGKHWQMERSRVTSEASTSSATTFLQREQWVNLELLFWSLFELWWDWRVDIFTQVCLKLMKNQQSPMTMCDSSEGFLITSGSALLELEPGDAVSLVPVVYNSIVTSQSSASNIFTGFLLFPTAWRSQQRTDERRAAEGWGTRDYWN